MLFFVQQLFEVNITVPSFHILIPTLCGFLFCNVREVFKNQYKPSPSQKSSTFLPAVSFFYHKSVADVSKIFYIRLFRTDLESLAPQCVLLHRSVAFLRPIFILFIGLLKYMKSNRDT